MNYYNNTTFPLVRQAAACCDNAYMLADVHSGLSGAGSFDVSGDVGVLVQITARPSAGLVLAGTPGYVWDVGWMSLSTGDGMLEEKRITREAMLWLPPIGKLATSFGFYLNEDFVVDVTELKPEPPPP